MESISSETGLSVANTSRRLQRLRQSQLVNTRCDGLFVRYWLSGPEVVSLAQVLQRTAEQHLAEVERVVGDSGLPVRTTNK